MSYRETNTLDGSKIIFTDESPVTYDEPGGLTKRWILSNSKAPLNKRWQKGGGNVTI